MPSQSPLEACPCCGYATLGARGEWQICDICWWEDDGQDDADADVVLGGPNANLSLTQARVNFIADGIFDPSREDLRGKQESPAAYARPRTFVLSPDEKTVREKDAPWQSQAFAP